MAQQFSTVINIDTDNNLIKFYTMLGREKSGIAIDTKTYRTRPFDDEFFERFSQCLGEFAAVNPNCTGRAAYVTVVLPDYLVATDVFSVPGVYKADSMASVTLNKKYSNIADLEINKYILSQNRQYTTYATAIMRSTLKQKLYTALSTNSMFAKKITFAGSATVNAFMSMHAKYKNGTFVFLDVKENSSRICFVVKGNVCGVYDLPFGSKVLKSSKPVAENMLFDYSIAELMVVNAKEKAKAKALTIMGGDAAVEAAQQELSEEDDSQVFAADQTLQNRQMQIKTLPKKTPRVLPKFMQRPIPDDAEGMANENFRVFVKWVLDVLRANDRITQVAKFESVFVNLPQEFEFVLSKANEEQEENKVKFVPAGLGDEPADVRDNLELYGGLFVSQYNKHNNF